MKVLIADDEEDVVESTRLLLETAGHVVQGVSHASDLPKELARLRPDVLLQDLHMPGLDVEGWLREARRIHPALAVVVFTAGGEGEAVRDRVGAQGVLDKPFEIEELLTVLKTVAPASGQADARRPRGA